MVEGAEEFRLRVSHGQCMEAGQVLYSVLGLIKDICIYIYVYVCIYIYIHLCVHKHMYMYVYAGSCRVQLPLFHVLPS